MQQETAIEALERLCASSCDVLRSLGERIPDGSDVSRTPQELHAFQLSLYEAWGVCHSIKRNIDHRCRLALERLDEAFVTFLLEFGEFEVEAGSTRVYAGRVSEVRCKDQGRLCQMIFDMVKSDLLSEDRFIRLLSKDGFKQSEIRELVGDEAWTAYYDREIRHDAKTGKAKRRVLVDHRRL